MTRAQKQVVVIAASVAGLFAIAVGFYVLRARLGGVPAMSSPSSSHRQSPAATSPTKDTASGTVPAKEPARADRAGVTIDTKRQQLIGVRLAKVERAHLAPEVRTVGVVRYDETRLADINMKLEGWIRELHVDYTGEFVCKGQSLFTFYSPELLTTQNEYLLALQTRDQMQASHVTDAREYAERLVDSARRRLVLWDLPPEHLEALDKERKPQTVATLRSPVSGYVIEKQALQGLHVMPGQSLYRVADLSVVWVEADLYEQAIATVGWAHTRASRSTPIRGRRSTGAPSISIRTSTRRHARRRCVFNSRIAACG